MEVHQHAAEPWQVTLIDTGDKTLTGGRLKRVRAYVGDETFCMTYGDGLTNLDIRELIRFHRAQKTLATLTAVQPPGRFGAFDLGEEQTRIAAFPREAAGRRRLDQRRLLRAASPGSSTTSRATATWEQEP